MKRYYLFSMALITAILSLANTFSGKVVDENGAAVDFATVSLLNAADSTFLGGTTTDTAGEFSLSAPVTSAIVKVTYIGYRPVMVNSAGNTGVITLQPESMTLGEVTVTGTRPTYKLTTEGIKTEVDGTLLSEVGTADKVLENLPGVQKKDEGIEVFGKGTPLIYVNGRQLRDKSELERIQSSDIKSVELITNPGAKYKADVGSVILITTKRPQGEGFSFDTQASYYRSHTNSLDLGVNWNYRHGGLDVFGSVWYNDYGRDDDKSFSLSVHADKEWQIEEKNPYSIRNRSIYASLGLNYIVNDNHALGVRYSTNGYFRQDYASTIEADITCDGEYFDHLDNTLGDETKSNMPHTLNAYYNGKVGGTSIDFNTDYIFFKDRKTSWNNEVSQSQESRIVTSRSVARNQLWASKLVLSWNLWGGNLQAGAEYDLTNRNDDYINPEQIVPTSFTEQRERNYTLFTEYSHPLPFGQLRVGLRNENVTSDYYSAGKHIDDQSRTYHHFFPSVGLMARTGNVQLMANYAMKIQRPYYYMLNGAVTYGNRFTWESGNPMLKPTIINEAGIMAVWHWINVAVRYKHSRDAIVNVGKAVEGHPETTLITRANVSKADAMLAMVTLSPKFGIWQPSLSLAMMKDWTEIPSSAGMISPERPIYLLQWNNNLRILPTLTASANLSITSKGDMQNMSLTRAGCVVYLSLTKTFLNDRLSVQVAGHNIFNAHETLNINYGLRSMYVDSRNDNRKLEVTVRYKFNSANNKWRGSGAGDDEKARFGKDN